MKEVKRTCVFKRQKKCECCFLCSAFTSKLGEGKLVQKLAAIAGGRLLAAQRTTARPHCWRQKSPFYTDKLATVFHPVQGNDVYSIAKNFSVQSGCLQEMIKIFRYPDQRFKNNFQRT